MHFEKNQDLNVFNLNGVIYKLTDNELIKVYDSVIKSPKYYLVLLLNSLSVIIKALVIWLSVCFVFGKNPFSLSDLYHPQTLSFVISFTLSSGLFKLYFYMKDKYSLNSFTWVFEDNLRKNYEPEPTEIDK